jgi:hypothetical protein
MKNLILIFTLLISTYSYATVGETLSNALDSTKVVVNETLTAVDTSSNFNLIYTDIKDGIAALASGLKVGAEHVYTILVKQQIVKAITWLILFILSIILIVNWLNKYNSKEIWADDDEPTGLGVVRVMQILAGICIFILSMINIDTIITGFVNPEYGAIETIIDIVKDSK